MVSRVLQTITEDYDSELDEIVTTIVGLQDAATTAITTSRAGRTVIPLTQNAGVVRIKTTAISVSGESVLELVDQSWKNEVGDADQQTCLVPDGCWLQVKPNWVRDPIDGCGRRIGGP